MRLRESIVASLLFAAAAASAQQVQLAAKVDRTQVTLGDDVTLTLTLSANSQANLGNALPTVRQIPGFSIVSQGGAESFYRMNSTPGRNNFISGVSSQTVLRPQQAGALTIPAFHASYDGKRYSSQPIQIMVTASKAPAMPKELMDENIVYPRSSNSDLNRYLRQGALFLRAHVDRKIIYIGETINVRYELYLQDVATAWLRNRQLSLAQGNENFGDLRVLVSKPRQNLDFKPVTIGGRTYQKAPILEVNLQPQKLGKLSIPSYSLSGGYGHSPWNSLRFQIPSPEPTVEVLPLPAEGRPATFAGAVGHYQVTASLDRAEIRQREAVALRFVVKGRGNVEAIKEPRLPTMPQFEQYGAISSQTKRAEYDGSQLVGSKTFEVALRPRESGDLEIPPIPYAYFDSAKGQYVEVASAPLKLKVLPNAVNDAPLVIASAPPSVDGAGGARNGGPLRTRVLNEDIHFIPDDGFRGLRDRPPLVLTAGYWGLQAVPLLLVLGAWWARRKRDLLRGDVGLARRRQARGVAGKRLKKARLLLKAERANEFHAELSRGVRGFLSDHLNVADRGLTVDDVTEALQARAVDAELIAETRQLLDDSDNAQYAPTAAGAEELRKMFERGAELIDRLAQVLK